ncbi:hypothetical protein C0J52_18359 [Blattella germanica]|nr:hypothetical protein C0J52_18359 [Blattella germanica]
MLNTRYTDVNNKLILNVYLNEYTCVLHITNVLNTAELIESSCQCSESIELDNHVLLQSKNWKSNYAYIIVNNPSRERLRYVRKAAR